MYMYMVRALSAIDRPGGHGCASPWSEAGLTAADHACIFIYIYVYIIFRWGLWARGDVVVRRYTCELSFFFLETFVLTYPNTPRQWMIDEQAGPHMRAAFILGEERCVCIIYMYIYMYIYVVIYAVRLYIIDILYIHIICACVDEWMCTYVCVHFILFWRLYYAHNTRTYICTSHTLAHMY